MISPEGTRFEVGNEESDPSNASSPYQENKRGDKMLELERIREGLLQSLKFQTKGIIEGNIPDGFRYLREKSKMAPDGAVPMDQREADLLMVDRLRDPSLEKKIDAFKKITKDLPDDQKLFEIAQRVFKIMGGLRADFDRAEARRAKEKPTQLIGEVGGNDNPGVCRHRALLFQILASECGLQTMMRNGSAWDENFINGSAHAWNEVKAGGRTFLVDTSLPPEGEGFNSVSYPEFVKKGGFPDVTDFKERKNQPINPKLKFMYFGNEGRLY